MVHRYKLLCRLLLNIRYYQFIHVYLAPVCATMLILIGTTACTNPPRFTRVVVPHQPHVSPNIHVRIAGVPTGTFLGASIASFVDSGQTTVKGHMHKPPHARSGCACALGRQYPAIEMI